MLAGMAVADTGSLAHARAAFAADRRAHLEQRLFAFSPLNLWLTGSAVYAALIGVYALAVAIDGAAWIDRARGGYALDPRARVALILTLLTCVALTMQRYTRLRDVSDAPALLAGHDTALAGRFVTFEAAGLKRATALGLVGGTLLVLVFRAPGVGAADVSLASARFVWFTAMTVLLAVLFARGVELTRAGAALTRRAIDEALVVDLMHIDRLYGWGRLAARNALTWLAVSAAACLLLVSQVSSLVSAVLLGACALMGLGVFMNTMRQVHRRIHAAKSRELETVRGEISDLRAHRGPEPETSLRLHCLLAYETRIAAVREWPFDQSILMRVLGSTLILALPWFGQAVAGVVVEHLGQLLK